jgi:hypothetical protein
MSISDIYLYSLLSGVAYADGTIENSISSQLKSTNLSRQFTGDASNIYDANTGDYRFLVADYSTTSAPNLSGFAAAVVQDRATNQVTIAFRGTEDGWIQPDYGADLQIMVLGTAQKQIVDMYNYVSRITARTGDVVNQYAFTTTSTPPPVGTRYTEVGIDSLGGPIYEYLVVTGTVSGLGLVPNGATVNFSGHSLGGHLALAASKLFGTSLPEIDAHVLCQQLMLSEYLADKAA